MNFRLLEKLIKLEKLDLNMAQVKDELESIRVGLEVVGLSPYESKAYIALVIHGYGNAETIATTGMLPRTSSYKVLESLVEKGYANVAEGRPRIYKPVRPRTIYERISGELKNVFDKLEMLQEIISEIGEPQLFFMIYGKDKVVAKIGELIDTSTEFFVISTPSFSEIYSKLEKNFQNALKRGIDITVISTPTQRVPREFKVVKKERLVATDIASDKKKAMLASSELEACGYTDNASLVEHLNRFLEILIEH